MQSQTAPVRFWWLKRSLVALVVLLACLALIRWWWGAWVDRQVERQLAEWRAAGQPVTVADFAEPRIADADNAAVALREAHAAWRPSYLLDDIVLSERSRLPLSAAEIQLIESELKANSAAMAALRAARGRSGTAWHVISDPLEKLWASGIPVPDRRMFELAWAAALLAHSRGDDAAAVEHLLDILFAARAVGEQPFVVSSQAANGFRRLAYDGVCQIAPRLNAGKSLATPAQLAALMAAVRDEAVQARQLVRAFHGDRLLLMDADRRLAEQAIPLQTGFPYPNATLAQRAAGFVVLPRVRLTALRDARFLIAIADHVAREDWLAAYNASIAQPRPRDVSPFYPVAQAEHLTNLFSMSDVMEMQLRALADRRAAVTAVAVRLYALDHGGRLPARLDELVPRYLPAVPVDPYANPPQPLRYLPAHNPPLIYSVAQDGVDDLGQKGWRPERWSAFENWWPPAGRDSIYPLAPATQPSRTQTAPDEH